MSIINFNVNNLGQSGVFPGQMSIQTNDALATVLAVGYLDKLHEEGIPFLNGFMAEVSTIPSPGSHEVDTYWLEVVFANNHWSLQFPANGPGSVVLPTIANHIATYTNTVGTLSEDPATAISGGNIQAGLSGTAGHFASFPATASTGQLDFTAVSNSGNFTVTLSNASHGQATTYSIPDVGNAAGRVLAAATATPFTANHILTASGTGGVVAEDANPAINGGSIQAGLSGTAGTLVSFPATAATGSLIVAAASNSGNTNVTISNSSHGQATAYHIADVANAAGALLNAAGATPFISGHLLQASGTAGVVSDSGVATSALQLNTSIKAQTTGNIGGAGAGPLTISQAACTSSSVILCSVKSSSNPCYVITIVPGSGSFTVTMSADPGASLIMDYVLFVAAQ